MVSIQKLEFLRLVLFQATCAERDDMRLSPARDMRIVPAFNLGQSNLQTCFAISINLVSYFQV